ncbi:hypothetical protein ACQJ7B_07795 [Helicobacter pylori]
MRDDNELELIGAFSLSNKLDWVRLELSAPMKMFLKSLDVGYSFKIQVLLQSMRLTPITWKSLDF